MSLPGIPGCLYLGTEGPGRTKSACHTSEGTAQSSSPARGSKQGVSQPSLSLGIIVHPTAGSGCPSRQCGPDSGHSSPRTSSHSAGNSPHLQWPPAGPSVPDKRRTAPRWEHGWGCCCPAPQTPAGREQHAEALAPSAGSSARATPGTSAEPGSSAGTLPGTFTLAVGWWQRTGAPISALAGGEVSPGFPFLPERPLGSRPAWHACGSGSPKEQAARGGWKKIALWSSRPQENLRQQLHHCPSHRRGRGLHRLSFPMALPKATWRSVSLPAPLCHCH